MESQGLKKYFFNTSYLLIEKCVRIFLTFFVWAAVIRYLGPDQFGNFSYALSFVFLFSIFAELGLRDIVVKSIVQRKEAENVILGSAFLLKFLGALFAIIMLWISTMILRVSPAVQALILILSLHFVCRAFENIEFFFLAKVRSKYIVYAKIIGYFVTACLCLLFIFLKRTTVSFAAVVFIEFAAVALGLIFFFEFLGNHILTWRPSVRLMKEFLRFSWPIIFSGVAISIYMRIDQIMIKEMLGAYEVGLYSAAVRVSEAFYFIPIVVTDSFFPAIVSAKMRSESLYYNRIRALLSMHLWAAIGLALIVNVVSAYLVMLLFGQEYLASAAILSLHVWAGVFVFLGVVSNKWCISENLQVFSMAYMILGAVVNIVLNFILIPRFSVLGAAGSTVISQGISSVFGFALHKNTRKMFFLELEALNIFRMLDFFKNRSFEDPV